MSADLYDFDVEIDGFDRLIDWIGIARDSQHSHSINERLYGQELLRRSKQLIDDILAPKVAESPVEGFYIDQRRAA